MSKETDMKKRKKLQSTWLPLQKRTTMMPSTTFSPGRICNLLCKYYTSVELGQFHFVCFFQGAPVSFIGRTSRSASQVVQAELPSRFSWSQISYIPWTKTKNLVISKTDKEIENSFPTIWEKAEHIITWCNKHCCLSTAYWLSSFVHLIIPKYYSCPKRTWKIRGGFRGLFRGLFCYLSSTSHFLLLSLKTPFIIYYITE